MESTIPNRLAVLGHPQRLAIFRLLMRRHPDHLSAGEIVAVLGVPPSTLSSYLASLTGAGLVRQARDGTSRLYAVEMDAFRNTLDYLVNDCCRGRPELCATLPQPQSGLPAMTDRKYNVLFICTGNSARSIFAETLLRDAAGDRFNAYSAGTKPFSELNPFAVELLKRKGHDLTPLRAKNVDEVRRPDAPVFDFVFTVCDLAANEECPAWSGQPISAHWSTPDPVNAQGTEAEKSLAFQHAYAALRNRITAFAALPIASLSRIALQSAVDDLAREPAKA